MSALDHPCVKTPHYDQLIHDGTAFVNHYAVCAPCGPARASLLTGMYMQNHRSVRNGTPLDDRYSNIAREVRRIGYRPMLFGYTDTSLDPRVYPEEQVLSLGYENIMPGFDEGLFLDEEHPQEWIKYLRLKGYEAHDFESAYRPVDNYPGAKNRGRTFSPPCYTVEHSQTAFLTQHVMAFIRQSNPGWFVHLSYLRPHPPFIAPEPYNRMYHPDDVPMPLRADTPEEQARIHPWLATALGSLGEWYYPWMHRLIGSDGYDREMRQVRATYYGLVSKVDHYIGQLMQCLKDSGQYDNTLILLTSDHGELLGDQWLFGKRGFFDSAFKIPLILKVPDQPAYSRGRFIEAFTESVDIMPTLLEWLGIETPRQCDGHSLLPFVLSDGPDRWRSEAHWEFDFRDVTSDRLENVLGITMDQCQMNTIRDSRYKYVHFTNLPAMFFDLGNDPCERHNLIDDPRYTEAVLALSQKMLSWRMGNDERTLTGTKVSEERIYRRTR